MDKAGLKKYLTWALLGLISLGLIALTQNVAFGQVPRHYDELTFPALPEIQLPEYERYQLDNGMVVYLVEDHQLPLVSGQAIIRTGSRLEPSGQVGLAEITGNLMRGGGTKRHSEDELDLILEQMAASVETSIGNSSGSASFSALSFNLEEVFNLFAQVIQEPVFDQEAFSLEKTKLQGEIARRNDDPGEIASREFAKLIYGESSPYARVIEYENLNKITKEDVIAFYRQYVRPERIILGIVGDFNPEKLKDLIDRAFGQWQLNTPNPQEQLSTPSQKFSDGVFLVDRPQLTQSNILIGHLAGQLDDPNFPTLSVINGILNGFGGRLYNEVRSRQGLAYSVYGFWRGGYDYPGIFLAGGQTKSETTVDFIQSLLKEIERLRTEKITEAELNYARESILNSFVFKFENPSQTLSRLMTYEYYGYPSDFIFQYQRGLKKTTVDDVLRVAREYLHPERIVTLVVGNGEIIKPSLSKLGREVQTVDISIPQPRS